MNGLVWTELDYSKELVAVGKGQTTTFDVECWKEKDGLFGIPRAFANTKCLFKPDKWACPNYDWPKLTVGYRPNQLEAINGIYQKLKTEYGGITELHTGFGKTFVSMNVADLLKTNMLVLCHKEDLLNQFAKSAKDFYGLECGWFQGDRQDYRGKHITVATIQSLNARMGQIDDDFWTNFGLVVADEGHRMPSATFTEVFSRINARYRLGMSATFRRSDNLDKIWEWHIGELIYENGLKGDPGHYYQTFVDPEIAESKCRKWDGTLNVSKLLTKIGLSKNFNKRLAITADKLAATGRQVLIVSDRSEQLFEVSKLLKSDYGFYAASINENGTKRTVKKAEREEAKNKKVILATYGKIAEGSDIPSLDTIIFGTPRKDVEQAVGRIQRKYEGKKKPLIVDPVMKTGYNYALANYRKDIYSNLNFVRLERLDGMFAR